MFRKYQKIGFWGKRSFKLPISSSKLAFVEKITSEGILLFWLEKDRFPYVIISSDILQALDRVKSGS